VVAEGNEGDKHCVVERMNTKVKNTLWDGMALIEAGVLPKSKHINGMALLRGHMFKACAFKSNIQLFFRNWCEKTGNNYDSYEILDMFENPHRLKDIKMITTDNAVKWKKFQSLMGADLSSAFRYWCDRVNADGSVWGIVKTDHPSKLGEVQQMSYQMVNTLPCTEDDVRRIA